MTAEAIVKSQARSILKDNFTKSITALFILLLPFYMIDGVITAIYCFALDQFHNSSFIEMYAMMIVYSIQFILGFLFSPVINGYVRAHYKASYSNTIDLKDVFYYFDRERYFDAIGINIRLLFRMLIPVLLLFSPLIIFDIYSMNYTKDFVGTLLYNDARFIFCVMSTTTSVLYSLRYYTVFTVSADNPQYTPAEVFKKNKQIMKNMTGTAAKLVFSFIPWLLLCLLILPMLYVIPYLTQSKCVSAKWITKTALEEK